MLGMRFTELEKTILLALYSLGSVSTHKYVDKDALVRKFPMRQRRSVRKYLEDLVQKKLVVKHAAEEKYRLNKKAKKEIVRIILKEGARIRF